MKGMLLFPSAIKRDPVIDAWLNTRTNELGSIAQKWYARMRACGNDVRELMHDGCPTVCVQDAPFGYVNIFKDHVNIGLFYGAELRDPADLLEGTGKRMRHVKMKPGCEPDSAALATLIETAYSDIKARLSKREKR